MLSVKPEPLRVCMCVREYVCVRARAHDALPSETACGLMMQQVESWYLAVLVGP